MWSCTADVVYFFLHVDQVSRTFTDFVNLMLSLPSDLNDERELMRHVRDQRVCLNEQAFSQRRSPASLLNCLWQFSSPEELKAENRVSCEACTTKKNGSGKANSTLQLLLSHTPRVLILSFKRFQQSLKGRFVKQSEHVSFPVCFDLSPFMAPHCLPTAEDSSTCPVEYVLYGVVNHVGRSLHCGHYTCYVKRQVAQCSESAAHWFHISDTSVREVSLQEVLQSEAYILFYERVESTATNG